MLRDWKFLLLNKTYTSRNSLNIYQLHYFPIRKANRKVFVVVVVVVCTHTQHFVSIVTVSGTSVLLSYHITSHMLHTY
jgi:hypothetical protein